MTQSRSDATLRKDLTRGLLVALGTVLFGVSTGFANNRESLKAGLLAKAGENNCSLHNTSDPSVPLCPESGSILPPWYPAAAVTIAEDYSLWSKEAEALFGMDRKKILADTIEKFWTAQPGKPPQIFLNGRPETRNWLIQELSRRGLGKAETIAKGITLNPDLVRTQAWTWQQDLFQESFDPSSGRPIMREITPYFGRGTRRIVRTTIARMQSQCGLPHAPSIHFSSEDRSGFAGGNIEGFPGGLCVVGSSDLTAEVRKEYFPIACGDRSKIVEIDTSYLAPGHVDEFFTVVPNRKKNGACAFSVLVASPMTAFDLLQSHPDEKAYQVENLGSAEVEKRIEAHSTWLRVCSLYHQAKRVKSSPKNGSGGSRTVSMIDEWEKSRKPASGSESIEERRDRLLKSFRKRLRQELILDEKFEAGLPKSYFRSDCSELTNSELLNTLALPEGRRYPNLDFNMNMEAVQISNVEILRGALKKALPGCEPEFIPVPQIFTGKTLPVQERPLALPTTGGAFNPSPTNGVLIGSRYLMPDPMNKAMRDYNKKVFERLGLELEFVDTYSLHRSYGNLHCATNVARYCRPRGAN